MKPVHRIGNAVSLAGRTALVTGATGKIGREICRSLAGAGVHIAVQYHSSAGEANRLCRELRATGVNAWPVAADFTVKNGAVTLVEKTLRLAGTLEIVINSASVFTARTLSELDWQDLSLNMKVNALAPLVIARSFAANLKKGRGAIINMLDSRIVGGDPFHAGYIASKQALAALTGMMALEFAPRITVNAVAPGLVSPPPGFGRSELSKLARNLPLRRHGEPGDVAQAVLFLLQSSFITGQVIYVDGGRNLRESMK